MRYVRLFCNLFKVRLRFRLFLFTFVWFLYISRTVMGFRCLFLQEDARIRPHNLTIDNNFINSTI